MKTCVIAEAGVNHNGSIELARRLALVARDAGCDFVKFQTFLPDACISKYAPKAAYQKETTGEYESQLGMVKKLALSFDEFRALKAYCDEIGIAFLSTAFDLESARFLHSLGCTVWKIPSGEVTNLPLLRAIASYGGEIFLSTGMCEMADIEAALSVLQENGCRDITLLHCTTEYPAPYADVNLRAMLTLAREFGRPAGYSDHTQGIAIPIAATALGAVVIEKHFTLDRTMEGPDHKASLEPQELSAMVQAIRQTESALGDGVKRVMDSEKSNREVARKSIVAACAIRKGERFTEENLTTKRPGTGLSPMLWDDVIGRTATRAFEEDELICL